MKTSRPSSERDREHLLECEEVLVEIREWALSVASPEVYEKWLQATVSSPSEIIGLLKDLNKKKRPFRKLLD